MPFHTLINIVKLIVYIVDKVIHTIQQITARSVGISIIITDQRNISSVTMILSYVFIIRPYQLFYSVLITEIRC